MDAAGPYHRFDSAPDSAHNLVVSLVPPAARVLEFGCATGYMSQVLNERLGCTVTGIELSPAAAERARKHCERVVVGDAEALDLANTLGDTRFDAIVFADVLEHLRAPERLLARVRAFLAEGGAVVASIPNIAHGDVRLALLDGEFRYRATGLLDRTHLRFFTRASIDELFEDAGYAIVRWLRRHVDIGRTELGLPKRVVPDAVWQGLAVDGDATTYQFVVRAVPRSEAAQAIYRLRKERPTARMRERWTIETRHAAEELAAIIDPDDPFILIDEDRLRAELDPSHRALPFPERGGEYWGPPADEAAAVAELQRLRRGGARFAVVAWPAFWWFEFYAGLAHELRSRYPCLLDNERLVVFDLRGEPS
jgi:2-polyprenyl-3-methyl-5-hydroxy-6-metoxy-1,4-benzoquinol methylase